MIFIGEYKDPRKPVVPLEEIEATEAARRIIDNANRFLDDHDARVAFLESLDEVAGKRKDPKLSLILGGKK